MFVLGESPTQGGLIQFLMPDATYSDLPHTGITEPTETASACSDPGPRGTSDSEACLVKLPTDNVFIHATTWKADTETAL